MAEPGGTLEAGRPNDRCDKCGTHISEWNDKPCVRSLMKSPQHTITRFYPGISSGAPDSAKGERG